MASKNRYKDGREKRDGGGHIAIPYSVLNGAAYLSLSPYGRMLLLDLAAQYRGDNNGDLCAAWKFMKLRGWKSEETLNKAKQEVQKSLLVIETRKGARPNKCSLYALTWFALDECRGKLDISPQSFPRGAYKLKDPLPVIAPRTIKNAN